MGAKRSRSREDDETGLDVKGKNSHAEHKQGEERGGEFGCGVGL